MGSSPSKGKLLSKTEGLGPEAVLPAQPSEQTNAALGSSESVDKCLEHTRTSNQSAPVDADEPTKETEWATALQNTEDNAETQMDRIHQETASEVVQIENTEETEQRKQRKRKQMSTETERRSSTLQKKMDYPPHMVRAHQAAYAFLNPNIPKYESLLGLLDQAAQTQLSLQPRISALVLCFEEINQALEEMAEEGEFMLKEHGDYMAGSPGMIGPVVWPGQSNTNTSGYAVPPSKLLQQLLQHSAEKMRVVGNSVQTLGNTTAEESVGYFSSLPKLLVEKFQAKNQAEQRLSRVLRQIEGAARRMSHPEDSSLHSEDSGIGGENESVTGSEGHHCHQRTVRSGSCGPGISVHSATQSSPYNLHNSIGYREKGKETEEQNNGDEDEGGNGLSRKRSNSLPPDRSQSLLNLRGNHTWDHRSVVKCPVTANIMMGPQSIKKNWDWQTKQMVEIPGNKAFAALEYNTHKPELRRHSLSGMESAEKLSSRTNSPPGPLPILTPQLPKPPAARRLINTYSQGIDGGTGQGLTNTLPPLRIASKSGILLLSEKGNGFDNHSWPDRRDNLELDKLPPPPPEVLMDNSFQTYQNMLFHGQSLPQVTQKPGISQRLKESVKNVQVLPNRASYRPKSISTNQNDVMENEDVYQHLQRNNDPEIEGAAAASPNERQTTDFKQPVMAPPVSRVRLPPSCSSVRHYYPSPPALRPESSSRTSSRPISPRTVVCVSDSKVEEIVPSVSFHDARSVFCRDVTQSSQICSGEGSARQRPKIRMRGADNSSIRTQSD